jgi:hypothetical protein
MEAPPANLLAQYTPIDRSKRYVQGMIVLATDMGLELTDEQLSCACAWFLSHPELGMQYLKELKDGDQ